LNLAAVGVPDSEWVSGAQELQGLGYLYLSGSPHDLGALERQKNCISRSGVTLSRSPTMYPSFFKANYAFQGSNTR
jgi:hypothetical protein